MKYKNSTIKFLDYQSVTFRPFKLFFTIDNCEKYLNQMRKIFMFGYIVSHESFFKSFFLYFQYLDRRFSRSVRLFGSIGFIYTTVRVWLLPDKLFARAFIEILSFCRPYGYQLLFMSLLWLSIRVSCYFSLLQKRFHLIKFPSVVNSDRDKCSCDYTGNLSGLYILHDDWWSKGGG